MTGSRWHIECLGCGAEFRYEEAVQVRYNQGHDWEDGDTLCPRCGKALQDDPGYAMHDGPVPSGQRSR